MLRGAFTAILNLVCRNLEHQSSLCFNFTGHQAYSDEAAVGSVSGANLEQSVSTDLLARTFQAASLRDLVCLALTQDDPFNKRFDFQLRGPVHLAQSGDHWTNLVEDAARYRLVFLFSDQRYLNDLRENVVRND